MAKHNRKTKCWRMDVGGHYLAFSYYLQINLRNGCVLKDVQYLCMCVHELLEHTEVIIKRWVESGNVEMEK